MAIYATVADLLERYDVDVVGDFSTDQRDTRLHAAINSSQDNDGSPNTKIETALCDASGDIDAALRVGGRYTDTQIAELINPAHPNYDESSTCILKRICCDIAMAYLVKRRVTCKGEEFAKEMSAQARAHLDRFQAGENVLGIPEVIEAGILDLHVVSTIDREHRNLLPFRMGRYFPTEHTRTPRGG